MLISNLKSQTIPDSPGVYFFKKGKELLYIGKATSLQDRIKSYFGNDLMLRRGPKILKMIQGATEIKWQETNSVLEALILEANLIKKYLPEANTLGKDNKSYNHVIITDEEYPRVILIREHDLKYKADLGFEIKYQFGAFPHAIQLKEALKIIRKIFPFRGEKDLILKNEKRKSSLNVELGLAPDFSLVSKTEYKKTIRNIKLFFEGKNKILRKKMETDMKRLSKKQEFEKAEQIKRQLFALDHIQDIALLKEQSNGKAGRIEAYDVAHLSEKNRVGVMTVVRGGVVEKQEYRKFKIKQTGGGDVGALAEILRRRFSHPEWIFPELIVVDGGKAQLNMAKKIIEELKLKIAIVSAVKDERHQVRDFLGDPNAINKSERDILLANSEAHRFALKFHRLKRNKNNLK